MPDRPLRFDSVGQRTGQPVDPIARDLYPNNGHRWAFLLILARTIPYCHRYHTAPNPFTLAELTQIPNVIANSAYDGPVNELTSVADATAAAQLSDQPAETVSTASAFITDNPQNISPTTESMPFTETATTLSPTRRSKQRENGIDRFTIETAVILLVSAAAALGAAFVA